MNNIVNLISMLVKSFRWSVLKASLSARFYGGPIQENTEGFIDLRSDTVTRLTPKMREAIAKAPVSEDFKGDEPRVKKLENEIAKLFGKDASILVPSGTMSNLICMMVNV